MLTLLAVGSVASAGAGFWAIRGLDDAFALTARTSRVIVEAEGVLRALVDAETGQRGFLLTGEERYLQPYTAALGRLPAALDELGALLAADPAQLARLGEIRAEAEAKLAEFAETVALRRAGDAEGALRLARTEARQARMDALRSAVTGLGAAERQHLAGRIAERDRKSAIASGFVGLSGVLVALLAASAGFGAARAQREARERAERALSGEEARVVESEARFRAMADNIPQLAWMTRPDGWIFWYNRRWFDYTGTTLEQMQGWGWGAVHHPDHLERVVAGFHASIEAGEPWEDTFPLRGVDGRWRWFLSRAVPVRDAEGRVVLWFGTNTDVTESREAGAAIRESEARLRATVAGAPFPIFLHADDGEILQVSSAVEETSGWRVRQDFRTIADWTEVAYGERKEAVKAIIDRLYERNDRVDEGDFKVRARHGGERVWSFASAPVGHDARGRRLVVSMAADVTELRRTEAELRASEERLRLTTSGAGVGIWDLDLVADRGNWSPEAAALLGLEHREATAESWVQAVHPEDRAAAALAWRHAVEEGAPYEATFRPAALCAPARWVVSRGWVERDAEGQPLRGLGVLLDVSAIKGAEAERDRALSQQRAVYANAPVGLAAHDRELRFIAVNERLAAMNGVPATTHIGRTPREILPAVADTVEPLIRRVLETGEPVAEVEIETETAAHLGERRFYVASYYPVRADGSGEVEGVSIAVLDVDARRRAEAALRDLTATLEQRVGERTRALSDTVAELDSFAYTVSHDLRAPLRGMEGFAQALLEDYADKLGPQGRRYAERIAAAAQRMDGLIGDLLEYSRLSRTEVTLRPVDLAPAIEGALADVREAVERRGGAVEVAGPMSEAIASPPVLRQVLANLLGNAVKFVPPGEVPRVTVWAERKAPRDGAGPGCMRLWVEDNGIGIAPEHRERIFRVFERLHADSVYPGTGIGLAIVRRGAERMGGSAGVEERADGGRGSRFWVELPAAL